MPADSVLDIDHSRPELQGFDAFYQKEIEPWMSDQQNKQADGRRWMWMIAVPAAIFLPVLIWLAFWVIDLEATWGLLLVGGYVVGAGFLASYKLMQLKGEIKNFLLDKVCGYFGFTFSEAASGASFELFKGAGLLPGHDKRKLEDEIRGSHGGVEFDLMECRLTRRQRSRNSSSDVEVYHGLLLRFTFPKAFHGTTLVTKDSGLIGNFFKGMAKPGERIKLEDPRFEKQFEVWGTDQIEARYLLTPTFMERVVDLAESIDESKVEFCFKENRLLMSLHVSKDHFEGGGMFTHVTDKKRVEDLVDELCKIFDIIDTLQLTLKTRV